MNEKRHAQMEPDNEAGIEQHEAMYAKAGYPFPMGPVIPRPNPTWPPLWPGLVQDGLDRPKAAAEVILRSYLTRVSASSTNPKGELITRMNFAFRNWWTYLIPNDARNNEKDGWKISQKVARGLSRFFPELVVEASDFDLKGIREKAPRPRKSSEFWNNPFSLPPAPTEPQNGSTRRSAGVTRNHLGTDEDKLSKVQVNFADRLDKQLRALYHLDKDGKIKSVRCAPLIFSKSQYALIGEIDALPWVMRYSDQTKNHVTKLLLEPAGEWSMLTLLFIKLLHAHMGWLAPEQIRPGRQEKFYRPLLRHLRLCAEKAGQSDAHQLAGTAAGVWQTLRHVNLLISSGYKTHSQYPDHQDPLDPRCDLLPESLHMDSAMGVKECLAEVKEILRWMDDNSGGGEWVAVTPLVDEVAMLAWEMASVRTDPFAMAGLGIVSTNQFKTRKTFTAYKTAWSEITRGVDARVRQINGWALSEREQERLDGLPTRFKVANILDGSVDDHGPNTQVNKTMADIKTWAERSRQLGSFNETIREMLMSYGLDKFQSTNGDLK